MFQVKKFFRTLIFFQGCESTDWGLRSKEGHTALRKPSGSPSKRGEIPLSSWSRKEETQGSSSGFTGSTGTIKRGVRRPWSEGVGSTMDPKITGFVSI